MGIFKSKKNKSHEIELKYTDGLCSIDKLVSQGFNKPLMTLKLDNDRLKIHQKGIEEQSIYLSFDQISNLSYLTKQEIIEKNKTVLGRAFIGNLALGPLGAIVGGISGVGNKSVAKNTKYLVINYKSAQSDEIKVLSFEDSSKSLKTVPFVMELLKHVSIDEPKNDNSYL